ncbi:MAG: YciI family protein [Acidobacteriaceae bacterium]
MRYMMIMYPKDYLTAKPGFVPDMAGMEKMGQYNQSLGEAGVLVALDGLTPPATMSARVTFKDGQSKVTDGPFTEAKEVVGGYWIIDVKSREEALAWAARIPGTDSEMVEVRRMFDLTDFDAETQKDIQKKFGDGPEPGKA